MDGMCYENKCILKFFYLWITDCWEHETIKVQETVRKQNSQFSFSACQINVLEYLYACAVHGDNEKFVFGSVLHNKQFWHLVSSITSKFWSKSSRTKTIRPDRFILEKCVRVMVCVCVWWCVWLCDGVTLKVSGTIIIMMSFKMLTAHWLGYWSGFTGCIKWELDYEYHYC